MEPTIVNAIQNLCRKNHSDATFTITGDNESIKDLSTTILRDGGSLGFTFEDATTELVSLKEAYDVQEYARARQPLYPEIGDQLDDLYHKGAFSAEMIAKLKKVKDDNPK